MKPSVSGFSAGISRVNTPAYVGRGHLNGQFVSGRVSLTLPTGVLSAWGGENYIQKGPEYLIVPNNCVCSWVPPTQAINRVGLIHVHDPNYHFLVGRKNLTSGQVAISKVQQSTLQQWYANQNNFDVQDAATEVLVCETP